MSWSQLCFQHHPAQSQAWRGFGRSYRRVTVCAKYSCEQICENQCWVSSSGKVEMGDIFGTFISTYKDSYQEEERAPPILESGRCVTLLTATLASFMFLELPSSFQLMDLSTCYSHSVGTLFSQFLEQLSHFGFCISAQGTSQKGVHWVSSLGRHFPDAFAFT